ncbi:MAG: CehA/McbA family metallohydrolase [Peptostreptococcaceae bacterium]
MTRKKIIFLFTIGIIFSICFITFKATQVSTFTSNNTDIECEVIDSEGPTIKSLSPSKCQQYIIGKPSIHIKYSDKSGIDVSSVKLYVNYKNVTKECLITNESVTYTPEKKFKKGNQIIKMEVCDLSANKNKSCFEWYFTVGTPVYNHYYGLLHSHTSASDGHGKYGDAYYLARDEANLDFFAITDHSSMLDNFLMCNIQDGSKSSEWTELIEYAEKFTTKNEFLALNGFEMTYPFNTQNKIGHINIFNTKGFTYPDESNMDLENFYMLLYEQENAIGQFNHPGDKFGDFNNFKYSYYGDEVMSLFEVENGYNKDLSKNIKSFDMYQLALDKGWHLAPTCNQDNHRVDFGIANELRTVILSTDLSRDALYDSLKNMRVYATEDKNIKIDYTINNLPMGSIINKSSNLNFAISVIDKDSEDIIEEIQVISSKGKVVKSKNFKSNLAKLDFTLKPTNNTFYYVKVIQKNNKISVTAPIWIEKK